MEPGDTAPDFSLPDQNGKIISLADFKGEKLILYFYPKDNTPGCTKEACEFRDKFQAFKDAGITIIGVSKGSPKSHTNFVNKFSLPFTLLADTTTQTCQDYGVWKEKTMCGRKYMGIERTTFFIQNNQIAKIWTNVKPENHAHEIILEIS